MSGSEQQLRAGHVQLDSRPILPTTDGNENITEVDALNISHVNTWDLLGPSVDMTVAPQPCPQCAVTHPMMCFADKRIKLHNATPKHTSILCVCCHDKVLYLEPGQSRHLEEKYKMDHQRRGVALIFNHEHFFWQLKLRDRRGTEVDRDNLNRTLTNLGFEVRVFDNLKKIDVQKRIDEASKEDHSNADCFVCVFLSHGKDDHIYANDDKIEIQTMTDMFRGDKCQSLVGKPKIFIIQACRGDQHDNAVIAHDATDSSKSPGSMTEVDAAGIYTLPAGADFIMCYSVAQGYYSHRDIVFGSWYIQDLCETLRDHGSSGEFTELLTVVNRKVSDRTWNTGYGLKKQIPCFASMLTKKLYFHPKSK